MGRGNRKKKNEGGNVEIADFSSNLVVDDTKDNFTQVSRIKNKKNLTISEPPSKENNATASYVEKLAEKNQHIPKLNNKQIKENNTISKPNINRIDIHNKRIYVNNFINYYWNAIGKYEVLQDIEIAPESDDEDDNNYEDY